MVRALPPELQREVGDYVRRLMERQALRVGTRLRQE